MNKPEENLDAMDDRNPTRSKGKRALKIMMVLLVVFFIASQFVPVARSNAPVENEISAPAEVKAILKRSCYDCHSNETVWPWYSYVAPMSWLVAHDVEEGREEMNFSRWDRYSDKKKRKKISECWEEVEEGEMPLWFYLPLHPKARLSKIDLEVLRQWAATAGDNSKEPHRHDDHDDD